MDFLALPGEGALMQLVLHVFIVDFCSVYFHFVR